MATASRLVPRGTFLPRLAAKRSRRQIAAAIRFSFLFAGTNHLSRQWSLCIETACCRQLPSISCRRSDTRSCPYKSFVSFVRGRTRGRISAVVHGRSLRFLPPTIGHRNGTFVRLFRDPNGFDDCANAVAWLRNTAVFCPLTYRRPVIGNNKAARAWIRRGNRFV